MAQISPQMEYNAVHKVLPFIKKFIKKNKGMVSPSMRQIGDAFERTPTWAWMCVKYLIQQDYLTTDPNRKYKNIILK